MDQEPNLEQEQYQDWKAPETGQDTQETTDPNEQLEQLLKEKLQPGIETMDRAIDKLNTEYNTAGRDRDSKDAVLDQELRISGNRKLAIKAQGELGFLLDDPNMQGRTVIDAIFSKISEHQSSEEYNSNNDSERQTVEDMIAPLTYLAEHLDEESLNLSIGKIPQVAQQEMGSNESTSNEQANAATRSDPRKDLYEAANKRYEQNLATPTPAVEVTTPTQQVQQTETAPPQSEGTSRFAEIQVSGAINRIKEQVLPNPETGRWPISQAEAFKGLGERMAKISENPQTSFRDVLINIVDGVDETTLFQVPDNEVGLEQINDRRHFLQELIKQTDDLGRTLASEQRDNPEQRQKILKITESAVSELSKKDLILEEKHRELYGKFNARQWE
ncbi:MAG: hypothetical protein WD970_02045 [Patescibacteria group bacterium]